MMEEMDLDNPEEFFGLPEPPAPSYHGLESRGKYALKRLQEKAAVSPAMAQNMHHSMRRIGAEARKIAGAQTDLDVASEDLLAFTKITFPGYRDDPFHKHLAGEITNLVMNARKGIPTKLMVFAPPQHGKSELVSIRTPSFWLANNPDLPVGLVSYAASLAHRNSRAARDVMTSHQFIDIFGDKRDPLNWRQDDWHLSGSKGYCLAVGVGGAITGHGFGLGIVDDPVENWAAAQSETLRESIWQWWLGTFTTRLWERASLLFIMTRWHEGDLAARVLENEGRVEEGGDWRVLKYTALSEGEGDILGRPFGEPLAPSRYSKKHLEDTRRKLGEYVWNAEYQQNPTPPKGSMFKIGRIEIVNVVPAEVAEVKWDAEDPAAFPLLLDVHGGTRFWDLAGTEKDVDKPDPDHTASALVRVYKDITYILDVTDDRLEPDQVERLMRQTAEVDGVRVGIAVEQEPGQSGKWQISSFLKLLKGFKVEGFPSSGDKRVRASPLAAQVNGGNVVMLRGKWNKMYLDQIANFPYGKHDDMADASSGGYNVETGITRLFRKIGFKHV
jgi:predicted phage terminase large subunit-like protein